MSRPTRRDTNADATRAAILAAARDAFAGLGYAAASLTAIADDAGATTGAIYHHFKDKKGLFRAVAEDVETGLMARVAEAVAAETGALTQLHAGLHEALAMTTDRGVARIILEDAASVLGAAQWREIEMRYAFGALVGMLRALDAETPLACGNPELAASMLLGALMEAGISINLAADRERALAQARLAMDGFLRSLIAQPNPRS